MGMFDQGARYACRTHPGPVAERLLRKARERLELEQFHDTRTTPLPGQKDRTVDSVLALRNLEKPASPCLVILDFQAQHDEDKLSGTLVSVAHMHHDVRHGPERKARYLVFAGFVYLRGRPPEVSIGMTLTDKAGEFLAGTQHTVLCWNVEEEDATVVLAEIAGDFDRWWGLLFWGPLMRNAALPGSIASWLALVKKVLSKRHQADLGRIALVFAELAGTFREWKDALKEFDMQDSQVVLGWTAEAARTAEVNALRRTLLRQAKKRFKGELTEEDEQMIATQDSTDVLQEWLDAFAEVTEYAEFRAALRR